MVRKILLLLCVGLVLQACTDDPDVESGTDIRPDGAAKIYFELQVCADATVTRAVSAAAVENAVNNIYLLIFSADGSRLYGRYYAKPELAGGRIAVTTLSGNARHIYAVANLELGMMALTRSDLDAVQSESNLRILTTRLTQQAIERGSSFLMSGCAVDASGAVASVDIPAGVTTAPLCVIPLRRVDSKIRFNVTTPDGVTFTPRDWRVVNIPRNVSLYPTTGPSSVSSDADYFASSWTNFEGEGAQMGRTFAFYLLENLVQARAPIPTIADGVSLSSAQRYALREKQTKLPLDGSAVVRPGQTQTNGEYLYAPAKGTYVQMRGYLLYKQSSVQEVSADVVYTIHLGYTDNNVDDYNNKRNTYYTYNVRIESVNNILVEVQYDNTPDYSDLDNERQPGAEGSITLASQIFDLDAHYEVLPLTLGAALVDPTLTWYVSTPFGQGAEVENPADYQWILFKFNPLNALFYTDTRQPYPGDGNYTAGSISHAAFLQNRARLLDVKQLVALLKATKIEYAAGRTNLFDAGDKIILTAYINENYYDRNPADGSSPADLWKQFVNRPQRVMNILSNTMYSHDGQSMKSTAVVSFRQASIQTMYSLSAATQRAWGTEMVQDLANYSFSSDPAYTGWSNLSPAYNSSSDGRNNTLQLWNVTARPLWNTYVNAATNTMVSKYAAVRYNCMRQNRDNNGDGVIDADEVRWYLAAINQLTDIWIGENSFDLTARLFKESSWIERWYASSTVSTRYQNGGSLGNKRYYDDPIVLWSSEGSSVGLMSAATTTALRYRCVRNLGQFSTGTLYEDFAQYNSQTGIFDLSKLDAASIRGYTQAAELQEHHEREQDNKPWWRFQVEKSTHGTLMSWIDVRDAVNNGSSPCPAGWRVPNQRELSLMQSRVKDTSWTAKNHMSRTRFQFNPTGGQRVGFAVSASNDAAGNLFLINSITDNGEKGGVRCVKDLGN